MKRIVIYIDGSPNDQESLAAAVLFCERVGAQLTVMHLRIPEQSVGSVSRAITIAERAAESAKQAFETVCGDLPYARWLETEDSFEEAIRHQGILHDATILERTSQEEGPEALALNTALFETGGPVLITPPEAPTTLGESVAVVWSPSVQSTRALRSATPLLTHAKKVTILTNSAVDRSNPDELAEYLACHGVTVSSYPFDGTRLSARGRGRAILAAVADISADLLVMGAYGENRLNAIIGLGRATRKVISAAPVPILVQN